MRWLAAFALSLCLPATSLAHDSTIHIWGTPALLGVAQRWAEGFRREHPEVEFSFFMKGSDSAIHGLVGGVADIALMGRANDVVDDNGFRRPKQYPVTRIEVATGSVSTPGKSEAIAVLVHLDNPLVSLTVDQLAAVLDCGDQHEPIAVWGGLGLTGGWANAPIHVHSYDFATRTGRWIQDHVTHGDRRMCWQRITEYANQRRLDGTVAKAADRIGQGASGDRYVLVLANAAQVYRGLRLVPIINEQGRAVVPDRSSVESRAYPFVRPVYAFLDRAPGTLMAPHIAAFMKFVLGAKGQALVDEDRGYLPLERSVADDQLRRLDGWCPGAQRRRPRP